MVFEYEDIIKVLLAILIGGLIGVEREYHDKAAGFRTIILICVGAALFTIFSAKLAGGNDPTRIAANIVTGIGFLGAGVIIRESGRVLGLTTAATIWLTASIGMGIGSGHYMFCGIVTGIMLIILWLFPIIEKIFVISHDQKTYEIKGIKSDIKLHDLQSGIKACGLDIKHCRIVKEPGSISCSLDIAGTRKGHDKLAKILSDDTEVNELSW